MGHRKVSVGMDIRRETHEIISETESTNSRSELSNLRYCESRAEEELAGGTEVAE